MLAAHRKLLDDAKKSATDELKIKIPKYQKIYELTKTKQFFKIM